jgi:glycosyltransferase involved in cell wall biosynthesis
VKILQINTRYYNGGSTGRIAYDLKCVMESQGIESYMAYGFGYDPKTEERDTVFRVESDAELFMSKICTKIQGRHGFNNKAETHRLLAWMDCIKPDLIHMHNIHNHYVNIELLLGYIAEHHIPCVLTMHDCWTFTGHCAYFDYSACDKWRTGCHDCPNLRTYPRTFALRDPSEWNYAHKKALFAPLDITFVSPSQWLCNLQQQSFLQDKPCVVINNGVDMDIFKPMDSDVRQRYGIGDRKFILAVAAGLSVRKGREYLLKLPLQLKEDEVLVIVGLQKKQQRLLPTNGRVIGVERTETADELVSLYAAADVFINPTLEDNFPTTNIEALACGTPVISFRTGGSGECVTPGTGVVVEKGDMEALLKAIRDVLTVDRSQTRMNCRSFANQYYNKTTQYSKYISLYKEILNHYKPDINE